MKEDGFIGRIEKRGNGYRFKIYDGYKADGTQNIVTKTWIPEPGMTERQIEKEANRQLVLFEEEVKNGTAVDCKIKFETLANEFLKQIELEGKLKTLWIERLNDCKERTYNAIGHLRMDRIKTSTVQNFINNLAKDGTNKQNGKGLATKTQKIYLSFISDVFEFAIKCKEMKLKNPCEGVNTIYVPTESKDCYDLEETQKFLDLLCQKAQFKYVVFFTIAIFTGFRKGEILGLEWKDIDFENCVITLSRTSLYSKRKGIITGTPKTKSGFRSIKVSEQLISMLQKYKDEQDKQKEHIGDAWHETDRLFTAWNGLPMGPDTPRHWLQKFCKKEGLRYVNVHSFRHFNASILIDKGCNAKDVSSYLGHSCPSTTYNFYIRLFQKAEAKASKAISDCINLNVGG